jgi:multisubunit Na+/H+ antiporter MnhB subunit
VFSVYLLVAGHNRPGGGFVGGLVASAAVALRYIAGGIGDVRSLLPIAPWTYLSAGLALAAGTAMAPLAFGHPPLDHQAATWDLGPLGDVKVTSAIAFDSGVFLIVVGIVLMALEGLGADDAVEPPAEVESHGTPGPAS